MVCSVHHQREQSPHGRLKAALPQHMWALTRPKCACDPALLPRLTGQEVIADPSTETSAGSLECPPPLPRGLGSQQAENGEPEQCALVWEDSSSCPDK